MSSEDIKTLDELFMVSYLEELLKDPHSLSFNAHVLCKKRLWAYCTIATKTPSVMPAFSC